MACTVQIVQIGLSPGVSEVEQWAHSTGFPVPGCGENFSWSTSVFATLVGRYLISVGSSPHFDWLVRRCQYLSSVPDPCLMGEAREVLSA